MYPGAILLACLAYSGTCHERHQDAQESLATLLLANNPAAAFMPSSSGVGLPKSNPIQRISRSAPVMADDVPDMSDVGLDMLNDAMDAAVTGDAQATAVAKDAVASKFDVQELAGITAPMGFFDPAQFCQGESEGRIRFYREVELKHGRVAMLASLGFLVGEQFHPLFGGNINVPSYIAFQETPLQTFWYIATFAISIPEVFSVFTFNSPFGGQPWSVRADHEPGNLGFDPLGFRPKDPKEWLDMQNKEINNGRLAMLAAAGMIGQELATGEKLFS
mmetsp:Transcript_144302/g.251558  ORF Transcript_144302/g.251558 Transcript_144302/m.251558 type:complete len:276 (-) Transcript_144302:137-964(-)